MAVARIWIENKTDILLLSEKLMQLAGCRAFLVFATIIVLFLGSAQDPETINGIFCHEYALMLLVACYTVAMFCEAHQFSINKSSEHVI